MPTALVIVITVAFSRFNVVPAEFVYDDNYFFQLGEKQLGSTRLFEILREPYMEGHNWRPLTTLTFATQKAPDLTHATGHRLFHLGLHLVNVWLAYLLVLQVSGGWLAALLAALLFAVHPIHVETLSGMLGRADLLSATAVLAACVLQLKSLPQRYSTFKPALLALMLFLGLLFKETAIMIVPLLTLQLWFCSKNPADGTLGAHGAQSRQRVLLRYLLPMAIVIGIYAALRTGVLKGNPFTEGPIDASLANPMYNLGVWRPLGALRVGLLQLRHLIWPAGLSPDYAVNTNYFILSPADLDLYFGGVLAVFFLATLISATRRRRPAAYFGWFALLTYLPVSNLMVLPGTAMADRYLYLPSIGWSYLAVAGVICAADRVCKALPTCKTEIAAAVIMAPLLIGYAAGSLYYQQQWKSDRTLLPYCADRNPKAAYLLYQTGNLFAATDPDRALHYYESSFKAMPNSPHNLFRSGLLFLQLNQPQRAVDFLRQALLFIPNGTDPALLCQVHNALALAFDHLGDAAAAANHRRIRDRLAPGVAGNPS